MSQFDDMLQRELNAVSKCANAIAEQFGYDLNDAYDIAHVLHDANLVKWDLHIGQFAIVHGAVWEADVMKRALAAAEARRFQPT